MAEIQRSKATYCHFTSQEYVHYDAVVTTPEALTREFIASTLQTKLTRMTKAQLITDGLGTSDVVFRVMSDTHLPDETDEKRRKKSSSGGWVPRTNFPPFQHYVLADDVLIEVGRSHWKGDLETGQYCAVHGKMTNRLATMFLLLVEQYSKRGNWRGYCVDEETEALTQRGWLGIDEITENDVILSYDQGTLKWSKIKSIFRDDYDGKMFRLTVTGMDALVTPGHKFVTKDGLKETEYLVERDKLILTGDPVEDGDASYSDAFVELVGWFVTEGNCYFEEGRNYGRVTIYQNEGEYADRIRTCLRTLNAQFGEGSKLNESGNVNVAFHLTKEICEKILDVAPDRVLTMPFILSLSQSQRELLIHTMVDADGCRKAYDDNHCKAGYLRYCQGSKERLDPFLTVCTLAGYRCSTHQRDVVSYGKPTSVYVVNIFSKTYGRHRHAQVESIDLHGGKRNGRSHPGRGKRAHPNEPTFDYKGRVWCPETEFGSFMARRAGTIYLTGNSYVSDMRGQALVQLSQVGLQFDESRSDNPFAWYTQIIKNCFRRILLLEKRNQDIRDDLLIMAGALPSFTRQVDDEHEQKTGDGHTEEAAVKKEPKKRGRKPRPRE